MKKTFETPDPVELYVELGSGSLIVQAADTDESVVEVSGPRAEEFTAEHRGRHLVVVPPKGRFFGIGTDAHTVRISVPTG